MIWMEVDGIAGGHTKKSIVCKNTINSHGESSWRLKGPQMLMYRGEVAQSGAVR